MAKHYTSRGGRLTAAITGKAAEVTPERARELNVIAVTRRIHGAERRLRELRKTAERVRAQLRADRRELRTILQAATVTPETP